MDLRQLCPQRHVEGEVSSAVEPAVDRKRDQLGTGARC